MNALCVVPLPLSALARPPSQGLLTAPHASSMTILTCLSRLKALSLATNQDDPVARLGMHCLPQGLTALTLQVRARTRARLWCPRLRVPPALPAWGPGSSPLPGRLAGLLLDTAPHRWPHAPPALLPPLCAPRPQRVNLSAAPLGTTPVLPSLSHLHFKDSILPSITQIGPMAPTLEWWAAVSWATICHNWHVGRCVRMCMHVCATHAHVHAGRTPWATLCTPCALPRLSCDNCDMGSVYVSDLVSLLPTLSWLEITYTHDDWQLLK